jgi:hypothetical protein
MQTTAKAAKVSQAMAMKDVTKTSLAEKMMQGEMVMKPRTVLRYVKVRPQTVRNFWR